MSVLENLRGARDLYHQAIRAELDSGCVAISLAAFGAECTLVDLLDELPCVDIKNTVERNGFEINWLYEPAFGIPPAVVNSVLEGDVKGVVEEFYPNRPTAGFLVISQFTNGTTASHTSALILREKMPRDLRRKLKKEQAHVIVDARTGGVRRITIQQLVDYINEVISQGGRVGLCQLKHR